MRSDPAVLSDDRLIEEIRHLVSDEFISLAGLLSLLAEMDGRMLYARLGYPSLFSFMVKELHLSEDAAYKRIQAARAARRFPLILNLISDGRINLTTVLVLSPILTEENHEGLLTKAVHRSKAEVEGIRAAYLPRPDVPDMMRKLPDSTRSGASDYPTHVDAGTPSDTATSHEPPLPLVTHARRDSISPISEERVKFQFTGGRELRDKIERARELLRHKHPQGKLEDIIGEALDAFLEKRDPAKRIEERRRRNEDRRQSQPSRKPRTRHIPQHVKDLVWQRDEGMCQYVSPDGQLCGGRGFLEFDHIEPFAKGGSSDDPSNLRVFCRTHNALAMRDAFGERHLWCSP